MLVLFDCDGVLIDSEMITARIEAEMLTHIGLPHTAQDVIRRFLGLPGVNTLALLEADFGGPLPADFKQNMHARLTQSYQEELQAIAGIAALLDRLGAAKCVASSSTVSRLQSNLTHTGLYERFFPHIYSTQMVARGKPHPDIFLYAAAQMGFAAQDCIVVEDSPNGVRAARAAGMRCIGFTGGSHCDANHAKRLQDAGTLEIVGNTADLAALLTTYPSIPVSSPIASA